jgi:NAD+ kinase
MKPAEIIGIVYNSRAPEAKAMTSALIERLNLEDRVWVRSASDVDPTVSDAKDTDLIITVGGDGTIIRAARLAVLYAIPILGINMGRLGFMTELEANEALDKVPVYMEGTIRVEERCMLQAAILPQNGQDRHEHSHVLNGKGQDDPGGYHALNDAVVGRGAMSRVVNISAFIDGAYLTDFRADAVMVSTATGSTGYNLSVGGPILSPQASEIILKAVAPHVGMAPALVLPSSSVVDLAVETDHQVMLSVDGYIDLELAPGDSVRVQRSPHKALFLRAHPYTQFYATLTRRLGFGGGQSTTRAIQY